MRNKGLLFILACLIFCACKKEAAVDNLHPMLYAPGLLKTEVISYTSSTAVVSMDFVIYSESGLLPDGDFSMYVNPIKSGTTIVEHVKTSLVTLKSAPLGCFRVGVLNEFSASQMSDRMEVATRLILSSADGCNQYIYGYHPARNKELEIVGTCDFGKGTFSNVPAESDQQISMLSFGANSLSGNSISTPNNLNATVDSLLDLNIWKAAENNHIVCTYLDRSINNGISVDQIITKALAKNVKIHAIKRFSKSYLDSFSLVCAATGGVYFMQSPFHYLLPPFESDASTAAIHFPSIFQGRYEFYRATFNVEMQNNTFRPDFWYRTTIEIVLNKGVFKSIPIFVQLP